MKIYTKTGDGGQTSLASGERVSKTDARLEAYGTADELNSFVGLLRCHVSENQQMCEQIEWIQNKLFNIGAALAEADGEWLVADDSRQLEQWMDAMQADLPPTRGFILPNGNEAVCVSHICRTITRRLERQILRMCEDGFVLESIKEICIFVNRLSDFWFVFAQKCGKNAGIPYNLWKK